MKAAKNCPVDFDAPNTNVIILHQQLICQLTFISEISVIELIFDTFFEEQKDQKYNS